MQYANQYHYHQVFQYTLLHHHKNFQLFSSNIVDRRGSYSSFVTLPELTAFENRKVSFTFKNIKVSILFSETITLPEPMFSTGSFAFIKARPGIDKSVGEPSLIQLNNVEVIYGPKLNTGNEIYYLSVLPVRTGFLLKKDDDLLITGVIYVGEKTQNIYISQFTWDYCRIFNNHNIALNTYIQLQGEDRRIIAHFFENLKL